MDQYGTKQVDWRYGQIEIFDKDEFIGKSLELYGEWAQHEIDFIAGLLKSEDIREVVVAGANIGVQSIAFGKLLGDSGKVHGFEVHPVVFELLERNVQRSGVSNITLYPLGLWDKPGTLSIPGFPDSNSVNFGNFSLKDRPGKELKNNYEVELLTLDSLELKACDLLFLDVEGAELDILKGASDTLQSYRPVIYSEVRNLEEGIPLFGFLHQRGYQIHLCAPLAYNARNFKKNRINIFGPIREMAMVALPSEKNVGLPKLDNTNVSLFPVKTYKELVNRLITTPFFTSKIYWASKNAPFSEERCQIQYMELEAGGNEIHFLLPSQDSVAGLRLDICDQPGLVRIPSLRVSLVEDDQETTLLHFNKQKLIQAYCEKRDIQFFENNGEGIFLLWGGNAHLTFQLPDVVPAYSGQLKVTLSLRWPDSYRKFYLSQQGRVANLDDELDIQNNRFEEILLKLIDLDQQQAQLPSLLADHEETLGTKIQTTFEELEASQRVLLEENLGQTRQLSTNLDRVRQLSEALEQKQGNLEGALRELSLQIGGAYQQLEQKIQTDNALAGENLTGINTSINILNTDLANRFRRIEETLQQQDQRMLHVQRVLTEKKKRFKSVKDFLLRTIPFLSRFIKYRKLRQDLALIRKSPLFDAAYYLDRYPDVAAGKIDPGKHYLLHGGFEGRNPSRDFDSRFYLERYPDVSRHGLNPLVHYLEHGKQEKRLLLPLPGQNGVMARLADQQFNQNTPLLPTSGLKAAEKTEQVETQDLFSEPAELEPVDFDLPFLPGTRAQTQLTGLIREAIKFPRFAVALSHDNYLVAVGGIQVYLQDEEFALKTQDISYIQLYPSVHRPYKLYSQPEDFTISVQVDSRQIGSFSAEELFWAFGQLLEEGFSCVSLHLHHFMSWNLKVLEHFIDQLRPELKLFFLHDYFTVCPQYNLLFNDKHFCHAPALDSNACNICKYGADRQIYFPLFQAFFEKFTFRIITPSDAAGEIWQRIYPDQKNEIVLIPHLELEENPDLSAKVSPVNSGGRLRMAFLGHQNYRKGWEVWRKLVDEFQLLKRMDGLHLGSREATFPEQFRPVIVNKQHRQAMSDQLLKDRVDVVLLWSIWPETYSYTLFESIAAGCFILTSKDSGNIADQVRQWACGLVLDSEEELFDLLDMRLETLTSLVRDFQKTNRKFYHPEKNQGVVHLIRESGLKID